MRVDEAKRLMDRPVFGSESCIHARDVLLLAEEVKKARRDCEMEFGEPVFEVAPRLISMDEKDLQEELKSYREAGWGTDWP